MPYLVPAKISKQVQCLCS